MRPKTIRLLTVMLGLAVLGALWAPGPARAAESNSPIHWLSLQQALANQQTDPRPVVIFFHLPWCGRCQKMERHTFSDPRVIAAMNQKFWPAMVDMSQEKKTGDAYGVDYIPTHVIVLPGAKQIWRDQGVIPADRYLETLQQALKAAGGGDR